MLLEVIVSALLVALIAVGTYSGLVSSNRAGVRERANAQATVIAQQDEERLRGLTVAQLSDLGSATHYVAENGMCVEEASGAWKYYNSTTTTSSCEAVTGFKGATYTGTVFTVTSSAKFVTAAKESFTCETTAGAAANYIQTTSSVNWPSIGKHSPVSQSSLVAVPSSGTLMVKVKNSKGEPVSGAKVEVFDPSTASTVTAEQTTPTSGCVVFGDLAEGTVKVVASKTGWVEKTGKAAAEKPSSINTKSLAEVELTIEESGGIQATFVNSSGVPVESFTFVAFQTEMGSPSFFVGGVENTPKSSAELTGLFPFVTPPSTPNPYTVYAGDCEENNPVTVTKGTGVSNEVTKDPTAPVERGPSKSVNVEAPEVKLTAYEGTTSTSGKLTATSAKIINPECKGKTAQNTVPYQHKVEIISGVLKPNHLPYAKKLELCAVGKDSNKYYKNTISFTNTAKAGTTESFYLGKGTEVTSGTTC
jgi:hypothetical protein